LTEIEADDEREVCGFTVRSVETPHSPNLRAYARRFEAGGRSLVFSGDTAARHETVGRLAHGANVLLHECYSQEAMLAYAAMRPADQRERIYEAFGKGHSDVGEVARIAREANVGCLVLTHLLSTEDVDSLLDTATGIFPGEVVIAYDGLALDV
jgi:ribonuclease BN (tRNA processing enzyme)